MQPVCDRPEAKGSKAHRLTIIRVALLVAAVAVSSVIASRASWAACKVLVRSDRLQAFIDRPQRYLIGFPRGGPDLVDGIRSFAAFDRFGLKAVAVAMRTANEQQKRSIGEGLMQAVVACLPRDGEVARQIADVIKTSGDRDVIDAYLDAAEDQSGSSAGLATAVTEQRSRAFLSEPGQTITAVPKSSVLSDPFGVVN